MQDVIETLTIPGVVGMDLDDGHVKVTVTQEFAEVPYRTLELQRIIARAGKWKSITVTTR